MVKLSRRVDINKSSEVMLNLNDMNQMTTTGKLKIESTKLKTYFAFACIINMEHKNFNVDRDFNISTVHA